MPQHVLGRWAARMSLRTGAAYGSVRARRAVITTCLANGIEWYDFAVYGALASVLASVLLSPVRKAER
jgi:hypothetical protein